MAKITAYVPYDTRDFKAINPYQYAYDVKFSSSKITVYWDASHQDRTIYSGSFRISGLDVNGTMTGVDEFSDGVKVYTARNLNYDAYTYLSYAASGNPRGLLTDTLKFDDTFKGSPGADYLESFAGHDTLDGGRGNDALVGGTGNDTYVVDSLGDRVVESVGAGTDRVNAYVSDILDANVENLYLYGTATNGSGNDLDNAIFGTGRANSLSGLAGNDSLSGLAGNDMLNGGTGNDTLDGGTGNDNLNGGEGNDTLVGGAGNDVLIGGTGTDHMAGGTGNDNYFVDSGNDVVAEAAGSGTDNVYLSINTPYTLGANVENLYLSSGSGWAEGNSLKNAIHGSSNSDILVGLAGNDTLYGWEGNDQLIGGTGNDTLYGYDGNDHLIGRTGKDTLTGGMGQDTFWFRESGAPNLDKIVDFSHADDAIGLDDLLDGVGDAVIKGLTFPNGVLLAASYFEGAGFKGNGAQPSGIYNDTRTGNIYYNPTSDVAGDAVVICTVGVAAAPTLDNSDFGFFID